MLYIYRYICNVNTKHNTNNNKHLLMKPFIHSIKNWDYNSGNKFCKKKTTPKPENMFMGKKKIKIIKS